MKKIFILIVLLLGASILVQTRLDSTRPPESKIEDLLYLPSGKVVKTISFGFDGLMADFYWLRSVQYYGRQLLDENNEMDWNRTKYVRYDLLYPLLDITTTLDPHYIIAYRFGALFLVDYDPKLAVKLLQKGIEQNPDEWRLYQNLGTVYWQMKDYKAASDAFLKGSEKPKAPYWMKVIGGVMLSTAGGRQTACSLYATFYEEARRSEDTFMMEQYDNQIKRIQALDEVDYLNEIISEYKKITGRCPSELKQLGTLLHQPSQKLGSCGQTVLLRVEQDKPISPFGGESFYIFDQKECRAKMPFEMADPNF